MKMTNPKYKSKHAGIPVDWRKIGEGGNAIVWSDGTYAIKRLKPSVSREARQRFEREAAILSELAEDSRLHIVPVYDVREREGALEIVMGKFEFDLEKNIHKFSGNVRKSASALLPVVDTLLYLSERSPSIFHRDIKPSNLLCSGNENELLLADFGCAYLNIDERITPEHRAIGSFAYRPPEYSDGRADDISEKGDVFGLGKVFWAMINGERNTVFPGPLWFLREYDLLNYFPDEELINRATVLIANTSAILPDQRPSLRMLSRQLSAIASDSVETLSDASELLKYQARIEFAYQQRREWTAAFIRTIHTDLHRAFTDLVAENGDLHLWREWLREANETPQDINALIKQVADLESDAPVVNVRFRQLDLETRFYPSTCDEFAKFRAKISSNIMGYYEFIIYNTNNGLICDGNIDEEMSTGKTYDIGILKEFLRSSTTKLMSSMAQ